MQKQKLETQFFLAMQATYEYVEIGLFDQTDCIDVIQEDKMRASKNFVVLLESLLRRNQTTLESVGFIVVNQGPGLFSALRSVIASANGLSFAQKLPLVGVDGLKAFLDEHANQHYPITVALLNAFNHEVYYGIEFNNEIIAAGYNTISAVLEMLHLQYQGTTIRFIGNGAELYHANILAQFSDHAYISDQLPQMVSIRHVGIMGLQKSHKQEFTDQLFPLYLKQHAAQVALEKKI
jgi:tRNA threonylcarbamoyl adenosine modification protein YeaZ